MIKRGLEFLYHWQRIGKEAVLPFLPYPDKLLLFKTVSADLSKHICLVLTELKLNVKKILAVINATYAVAKRKPEKIRLAGFEPWTLRYRCSALTNWANKPTGSWSLNWFVIHPEKMNSRWNYDYMKLWISYIRNFILRGKMIWNG